METLRPEKEGLFSEDNLVRLGNKLLPLLSKYEGWPSGKLEHMFASGEALQLTLVLAKILEMGITEEEIVEKIAEGEITKVMQEVSQTNSRMNDPQDCLFDSINRGRKKLNHLLDAIAPHLATHARGLAVDLASGSSFFSQNFARRWPGLKIYPCECFQESAVEGTRFMEWCLQQFAESPARDFEELAARHAAIKAGTAKSSPQVNLLDALWYPSEPPYPDPDRDAILSVQLLDRVSKVDLLTADWHEVAHLESACNVVFLTFISHRVEIIGQSYEAWRDIVRRAAKLLRRGGVLFLAEEMIEGSHLSRSNVEAVCNEVDGGFTIESFSSANGDESKIACMCALKKTGVADTNTGDARKRCAQLREQGNKCFNAKVALDYDKAIRFYSKALDIHSVGLFTDANLASRLESNLSAALWERGRFLEALDSADNAARWDPTWSKAQYRRMKALMSLERKGDALAASVRLDALKAEEDNLAGAAENTSATTQSIEQQALPTLEVQKPASPLVSLLDYLPVSCRCLPFLQATS